MDLPPFTSPLAAPAIASLVNWQRAMRHASQAARLEQLLMSLSCCCEALAIAQQLVGDPPAGRADDCVAALVVSHHNLADLQLQAGGPDLAAEQLCRAHEALMALLLGSPEREPDRELQQAAWRHSRETHAALLAYLTEHGPHPAIARALRAGCLSLTTGAPAANTLH